MPLIKKLFNTILILVGIALMVVAFGFGLMFIFKISIFGYTYSSMTNAKSQNYLFDTQNLQEVEIETTNTRIKIYNNNDTQPEGSIVFVQDFQGIVKEDVKKISFAENPTIDENGVMKITLNEPSGFFLRNDSYISICLPKDVVLKNLSIKSSAKDIDFGIEEQNFVVDNLSVVSTRKSFLKPGVTLSDNLVVNKDIYLETFAGRINVNSTVGRNVTIKSHASSIVFNKSINGDLTISGDYPSVEVGQITEKQMKAIENGDYDYSSIEKYDVKGNIVITDCQGGILKVTGSVYEFVYINSPNLNFWANKVLKGISCESGVNDIKIYGSLCSEDIGRDCLVKNGDGELYINNNYGNLTILSNNNIKVINSHNNVDITNTKPTYVTFADNTEDKTLTVNQKARYVVAKNIYGTVDINAESGDATVEFVKVTGANVIKAKYGVDISVRDGEIYTLSAQSKSASVDINMGSVIVTDWNNAQTDANGWKVITKNINTDAEGELPNTILAWSVENGSIKIKAVY